MYCEKCGTELLEEQKFCMNCGNALEFAVQPDRLTAEPIILKETETAKNAEEYTRYRNALVDRSKTEKIMLTVTAVIILFLTVLHYVRNPVEDRLLETLLIGGLFAGVLLAVYGLVAGYMGVYEATKYLKQYDMIKSTAGEKEAVLFIEKEYHPEERGKGIAVSGMKLTAGGVKTAGGCFVGCLQMITGFVTSIIAIIVAMAFC